MGKKLLSPEHPDVLISINNLACAVEEMGRVVKAVELYMQVLELRRKLLGPDHPSTLLA